MDMLIFKYLNKICWYTFKKKYYNIILRSHKLSRYFEFFSYYLQFEARKLLSVKGDVAIDDIAMSPKCFGLGK